MLEYCEINPKGINSGAWIEVNLDAVEENYETVKSIVGDKTKVCAVVKADAYGHGVYEIARLLERKGVDYLAVAIIDEGIELRKLGIQKPILVLGPLMPGQAHYVLQYNLTQTITTIESAQELAREAARQNKTAKIHLKIDTGMGRIGFDWREFPYQINRISHFEHLEIEGIFTHFATSDSEDKSYVFEQWNRFNHILEQIKDEGINIPIAHVATSATIIDLPFMKMDMVRPGLMLYGLYPRANMREKVEIKPALTFKAKISHLKEIKEKQSISYGRKYFAQAGEKIATLPIGYYDGFRRLLTSNSEVLVGGQHCPVVGTVCMDHILIDVTKVPEAQIGDECVIIGRQGREEITIEEIAQRLNTINYEAAAGLGRRLARVYLRGGQISAVRNLLGYHSFEIIPPDIISRVQISPLTLFGNHTCSIKLKSREMMRV